MRQPLADAQVLPCHGQRRAGRPADSSKPDTSIAGNPRHLRLPSAVTDRRPVDRSKQPPFSPRGFDSRLDCIGPGAQKRLRFRGLLQRLEEGATAQRSW